MLKIFFFILIKKFDKDILLKKIWKPKLKNNFGKTNLKKKLQKKFWNKMSKNIFT